MENDEIKKLVTDLIESDKKDSQYRVSLIPYHIHNNLDSPQLVFTGLSDVPGTYDTYAGYTLIVSSNETRLQFAINYGPLKYLIYRAVAATTSLSTGTVVGGDWVAPFSGTVTAVGATVDTAGTTGTMQVDINKNASTILSTKITLDSTEKSSRTAATSPVISVTTFVTGDIFTFDVDTVQTTPANGLSIFMNLTQTGT